VGQKPIAMTQKILSFSVFIMAIAFGMHVVGQTPPPASMPATNMPVPNMQGLPAGGSQPSPAELQNMLRGQTSTPQGTTGGQQPDTVPAFGGAAAKYADGIGNEDSAKPTPPKKEVFVPSQVETFVPAQAKAVDPRIVLHTSLGDITIRLYQNYAPKNVHTIVDLARGDREFTDVKTGRPVRRPFYNDLIFHRVVPSFLVQTGCPYGTGHGGPGFTTPDEINTALRFNKAGMVAMAPAHESEKKERKDSNGSQFFITLKPMPEWDDKFTIVGTVEKGMSVVEKIAKSPTGPTDRPIRRVYLNSVDVIEDQSSAGK
jgi:peptidyl-prolyl cis-trans isomerase A (cyclophilin A)